jgi:aminoglycoside phosphotransferase (APT) family kinase protein
MTSLQVDIERRDELLRYLRESGRIGPHERPEVRTLAGGVSNRTVLVQRPGGDAWVLKQALPKLRVPVDWYCSPERIHREALALRWLAQLAPPGTITPLVFEDRELHLLAMEAVPQPHENWKTMLLSGRLDPGHVQQFAGLLRTIHRNALRDRDELRQVFANRSFFEALRLEPYYEYTATRIPEAALFLAKLVQETRTRRDTLVHGDYSPKNVLVREGQLVLLDHEVAHFGDPGFDLGFSLTHLLSKAHHLPQRRADFGSAALVYWQAYDGDTELEPRVVRHTLGCLLARVAGRSPLEYLDEGERTQQQRAVLRLLTRPPSRVGELVEQFLESL